MMKIEKKQFLSALIPLPNINIIYKEISNIQIMKINKIKKKQFLSALILSNMNIISLCINIKRDLRFK